MKYPLATALLITAAWCAGCGRKEDYNNENSIDARADSIVGIRMQEINRQSMEDLEKRMTIEVKAKADSIVAARRHPGAAPRPDTANAAAPYVSDEEILQKSRPVYDTAR